LPVKPSDIYRSPCCGHPLRLEDGCLRTSDVVEASLLICGKCQKGFPIVGGIPRFVMEPNYVKSFGIQWNQFERTQLDSHSGTTLSAARLFSVTGWPRALKGELVLEAGSGMGRFTEVLAQTEASVFTIDCSNAIEANWRNNRHFQNVQFSQADIFALPFPDKTFDGIVCLGVMQHTLDPERAFHSLVAKLKEGGRIAIDVYDLTFRAFINPKYWLRPITKQLSHKALLRFIQSVVACLFPIKMWISEYVPFGKYFAFFIPIAYHKNFIRETSNFTYDQLIEFSILDTFDKYASYYDKPQTLRAVRRWFREAGLVNVHVQYGINGITATGTKPVR